MIFNLVTFALISIALDSISCFKENNQIDPKPFKYNYEFEDENGGHQFRREESDGFTAVRGAYGFRKPTGEFRLVDYSANDFGFKAHVKSNEKGIKPHSPADVILTPSHDYEQMTDLGTSVVSTTLGPPKSDEKDLLIESEEPEPLKILPPTNNSEEPNVVTTLPKNDNLFDKPLSIGQQFNVEQVLSESMPDINLSIEPKFFMNSRTRTMTAIPYLVMKTTSKMPLMPDMIFNLMRQRVNTSQNIEYRI